MVDAVREGLNWERVLWDTGKKGQQGCASDYLDSWKLDELTDALKQPTHQYVP